MERAVHHIKQQIFDIYAEDAERAHEIQLAIRHIASTELNIIAERLLDAFSIENYDIKIEQLKLDLGNVPIENLTRELPIRFEKALYEALSELISPVGELSTHQPKNVEIKSRDEANIDIIHFFLQYGRFPWWAKKDHFQFHILFNQQLSQNPTSIVNLLRDNKNQTAFFVRLSLQLSFHTLFHLLKSALKEHAAFIYEWIERQQKESSGSFTAKQAEKRRLLSKILKYIFQHQDNFSQEKFLAEMERDVSKDNLANYESQKEMDGASQNEEAKLANIEFFLQNGRIRKSHAHILSVRDLEVDLIHISQQKPDQIKSVLLSNTNPQNLGKRIYEQFSFEASYGIIKLLASNQEKIVRKVLDQLLDTYWDFRSNLKLSNYSTFKKEMYISTLEFLLTNTGRITESGFFHFLTKKIGHRQGIKVDTVEQYLENAAENIQSGNEVLSPWQALQMFFAQGIFPSTFLDDERTPSEVLGELLITHPEKIGSFLSQFQDVRSVSKRLLGLLSENQKDRLLSLVDMESYTFLKVLGEELKEKIERYNLNLKNFEQLFAQYVIEIILEGGGKGSFAEIKQNLKESLQDSYPQSFSAIDKLFPEIASVHKENKKRERSIALDRVYHFLRYGTFPMWDQDIQSNRLNLEVSELLNEQPLALKELLRNIEISEAINHLYDHLDIPTLERLLSLLSGLEQQTFTEVFDESLRKLGKTKEAGSIRKDLLNQLMKIPTPMTVQELKSWLGILEPEKVDLIHVRENTFELERDIPQALIGFVKTIEILLERSNLVGIKVDHVLKIMADRSIPFTPKSILKETIFALKKRTSLAQKEIVVHMQKIVSEALEQDEYRFYPLVDLLDISDDVSTQIESKDTASSEEEDVGSKDYSELEQLQFFIENGRIAPINEALSISELEALVIKLLDRGSSQIAGILGSAPITRLIHQFSEDALAKWAIFQQIQEEEKISASIALLKYVFHHHTDSLENIEEKLFVWRPILETLAYIRNQPTIGELHLMHLLVEQVHEIWDLSHQNIRIWIETAIPMLEPQAQATLILAFQDENIFSGEENPSTSKAEEESDIEKKWAQLHTTISNHLEFPNDEQEQTFNDLFRYLLIADNKKLINNLTSVLKIGDKQTLQNFISATRKENLLFLLSEWLPAQSGFIRSFMSVAEALYERLPEIFSEAKSAKLIQWLPILSYTLAQGENEISIQKLFDASIDYIEQTYQVDRTDILTNMREIIEEGRVNVDLTAIENLLETNLSELKEESEPPPKNDFSFDINKFVSLLRREHLSKEWEIIEHQLILEFDKHPQRMRTLIFNILADGDNRIQMINKLSEEHFWRLVKLFQPTQADDIREWISDLEQLLNRKVIKEQLLNYLYEINLATFDLLDFTAQLFKHVTSKEDQYIKLIESSIRFLEVANMPTKTNWLKLFKELLRPKLTVKRNTPNIPQNLPKETVDEKIYISNAGLVILWPFFTRYFQMSDLTHARQFKDEQAAERAAHLLQFLASGNTETPEHELVLNKILCGIPLSRPISASIEMNESEIEMSKKVLLSAVGNWEKMKNLPIGNLRGSFLLREGRLEEKFETWQLIVEPKPFDLLLDSLPWSISTIKLPWMPKILNVEWR